MGSPVDHHPFLAAKDYQAPSLFEPGNLLREARRQKNLPTIPVPAVGAPFVVLVAEQLDAPGAEMVVSITSAGQITPIGTTS